MRDSWRRYGLGHALLGELGFFEGALRQYRQEPAIEDDLALVHDPSYIEHVRRMDAAGSGCLDYGDTPAYPGVLRRVLVAVGGTLLAAQLVSGGEVQHAFNPGGGLHHARRDRAGGFCIFNDVVIAVRHLQREYGLSRIAIVDLDGHHGDGTQDLLYGEPVLTISLHRYDGRFYPGTGTVDEVGREAGLGYNLNVPLPRGTDGDSYLLAVREAVLPRLHAYRPEVLFVQIGADGHHADPLVRLALRVSTYGELGRILHEAAHDLCRGRLVIVAGGGYRPEAVARCWAAFLASVTGPPNREAARLLAEDERDTPAVINPEARLRVREALARLQTLGVLDEPAALRQGTQGTAPG